MSRFHQIMSQNPKERMMVMWTDGKPTTVIKTKVQDDEDDMLPFQYKIPLSKYNTLANAAQRPGQRAGPRPAHGARRTAQIVTMQKLPPEGGDGTSDQGQNGVEQTGQGPGSPVHNSPVHNSPVHSGPVHNGPGNNGPLHNSPVHNGPGKNSLVQNSPVQNGTGPNGPAQNGPLQSGHEAETKRIEFIRYVCVYLGSVWY